MASPTEISAPQPSRFIGAPHAAARVNACSDEDRRADPRFVPGSLLRAHTKRAP